MKGKDKVIRPLEPEVFITVYFLHGTMSIEQEGRVTYHVMSKLHMYSFEQIYRHVLVYRPTNDSMNACLQQLSINKPYF